MRKEELINQKVVNQNGEEGVIVDAEMGEDIHDTVITVKFGNQNKTLSLEFVFLNNVLKFNDTITKVIDCEINDKNNKEDEMIATKLLESASYNHQPTENVINSFRGSYSFLSNFYECEVTYNGLTFDNAEAAFQAQKNPYHQKEFVHLTGAQAKHQGRHVVLRSDWDDVKVDIMSEIVRAKFNQNPDLKQKLLETGDKDIIEGNNWGDTFWGVSRGKGQNHLGKILMKIRLEILADLRLKHYGKPFSVRVYQYLLDKGTILVEGIEGNQYKVCLSADRNKVELLDSPNLQPIELGVFDEVERCLDNNITDKGTAHEKVGSSKCDRTTIMGNIAYNFYHKNDGDSLFDAGCYIYAILNAAECTVATSGNIYKI